jgi:two-component system sensor histidine kinase VicK
MHISARFNDDSTFRTIIEASPYPVYLCMGEDLLITIANIATLKAWGKGYDVIGKPFHQILPELDNQPFRQLLLEVYHTGIGRSYTDHRADINVNHIIQTFYFNFSYQPFKDHEGKTTGVFCIANDITELILAKNKLAASEESARLAVVAAHQADQNAALLSAIIRSSNDAIISKNLVGKVESWNDAAERMFGYSSNEMIGQSIYKIIPQEQHKEEQSILSRLQKGEQVKHFETKRITKDQTELDISLTISPIKNKNGEIIGLSKIARDITEYKKAERQKNDFITTAGHELNTPLTSIKSYVQVLLAKVIEEHDTFKINALSRVARQTSKMSLLIRNLLDNARLVDDNLELDIERFDLNFLLNEVAQDAEVLFNTHHIKVSDCENMFVLADRKMITRVLENLLNNSVKYSTVGSEITMSCKIDGNNTRISVSDQGIGINKKDQARMFDRFFRGKNEKVRNVAGFGIGLYIVSEILRSHKSKIYVNSKENEFSTFYFDLPLTK